MKARLECNAFGKKPGDIVEAGQEYGNKGKISKEDLKGLIKEGFAREVNPKEVSSAAEIKKQLNAANAKIEELEKQLEENGTKEELDGANAKIEELQNTISGLNETAPAAKLKEQIAAAKASL